MTKFISALLCVTLGALALPAAPLTETAAVHTRPDVGAPTITFLKAGSEPVLAPDSLGLTPAGWLAVELPGPFEAYVQNKDIGKSLDVQPGASIHQHPRTGSTVITTMEPGDKASITGLHGKWTQIQLEKKVVGYVRVSGGVTAPIAAAPVLKDMPSAATAGPAPAPVNPVAYGVGGTGRPAPMVNLGDGGSGALPRLFQGKFVSSKRPFAPRRPYDWQLNDDAGVRYAYLDVSKLLLTEQIEKYVDHVVVVYGSPKPMPGGKDIVIQIESLQLK